MEKLPEQSKYTTEGRISRIVTKVLRRGVGTARFIVCSQKCRDEWVKLSEELGRLDRCGIAAILRRCAELAN
jgi:hypothetical protein